MSVWLVRDRRRVEFVKQETREKVGDAAETVVGRDAVSVGVVTVAGEAEMDEDARDERGIVVAVFKNIKGLEGGLETMPHACSVTVGGLLRVVEGTAVAVPVGVANAGVKAGTKAGRKVTTGF